MAVPVTSSIRIHYLSYGITKTGGYRHEKFLYKEAIRYFRKRQAVKPKYFRKKKLFYNLFGYLELVIWSFFRSNGHVNIVTARTGVSAMLRNWFNKKEVWIVLHNFDKEDAKSALLEQYYKVLFNLLKRVRHGRFKVIAVSPFFVKYFKETAGIRNTFYFPNFFDTGLYKTFITTEKNNSVHLGQYSSKNDPAIYELSKRLSESGYHCYFSTLNSSEAKESNGHYEIRYFHSFDTYLKQMSLSCCTLALTSIKEGWPRLAHESILVGTPVIGYANGGLKDLLRESNSAVVGNIDEAFNCIREAKWTKPYQDFIDKYDFDNTQGYIEKICKNL